MLELKNKETALLDSLRYAKGILKAISPPQEYINKVLPQSFIFKQPKNIIGGDFCWISQSPYLAHQTTEHPEHTIIVLADCTGHGVSGALLTIAFYYILNHVIHEHAYRKPSVILTEIRRDLKRTFFEHNGLQNRDGMDVAVLCLDHQRKELLFSSANIPLYLSRPEGIRKIKSSKESLTCYSQCTYTDTVVEYDQDTTFFLASDGFADQFGGPRNRKFMRRNYENLLLELSKMPMEQQEVRIKEAFYNWKGDCEQTDDVLVLGLRL